MTEDGERTSDPDEIFAEVFEYAERGLEVQGIDEPDEYLDPIRARWKAEMAPSDWKKNRVRESLEDGADLATAITEMQREYIAKSRQTESFVEWL